MRAKPEASACNAWSFDGIEWEDGYPTEESLEALRAQPWSYEDAARFILSGFGSATKQYYAVEVHDGTDFLGTPIRTIECSTGGWSGCESVFAIATRRWDVGHFLVQWRKGGHYVFEIPRAMLGSAETTEQQKLKQEKPE